MHVALRFLALVPLLGVAATTQANKERSSRLLRDRESPTLSSRSMVRRHNALSQKQQHSAARLLTACMANEECVSPSESCIFGNCSPLLAAGEVCERNTVTLVPDFGDCQNNACARASGAPGSPLICCPSGRRVYAIDGQSFDAFCSQLPPGEICLQNSMCASQSCVNGICGGVITTPPTVAPSSLDPPTAVPSTSPSHLATDVPSTSPSDRATEAPTPSPVLTDSPSVRTTALTSMPIEASDVPSSTPSARETAAPTSTPIEASDVPSSTPSARETAAPTSIPSVSPTSLSPSILPSVAPTNTTVPPTATPSVSPTSPPPSTLPSVAPTKTTVPPAGIPSELPSSFSPSFVPTSATQERASGTDAPTTTPSTEAPTLVITTDEPTEAREDAMEIGTDTASATTDQQSSSSRLVAQSVFMMLTLPMLGFFFTP